MNISPQLLTALEEQLHQGKAIHSANKEFVEHVWWNADIREYEYVYDNYQFGVTEVFERTPLGAQLTSNVLERIKRTAYIYWYDAPDDNNQALEKLIDFLSKTGPVKEITPAYPA